jgi:mannosyltransferase
LVVDGVSGVMVPPGQVDPLVASLRRLLSTPALRNRLAEGGRARVAQEFSLAVNLDRLQAAFAASG